MLLLYGAIGALYMLSLGPMQLLYALPLVILCIGGGWALIRWGRAKPPIEKS